uniref:Semaphorin 4B n=1 Tax=Sphenodon punctatus TaxID=8508 RepID=A0A8D0GGB9_SPHPU
MVCPWCARGWHCWASWDIGLAVPSVPGDCYNYIKILLQLNSSHLYVCGTCAFSPACTYVVSNFSLEQEASGKPLLEDGKGHCPFDPEYQSTAIMVDGELYAGTVSNFQGNEPTISRSQGSRIALKTENSLNWLQDPSFVGSAYLRESLPPSNPQGDDDKIYYFFSESGKEFDFFENTIVSRIARVCKGDLGGERVLQRRWTTFLKAQLLCSRAADGFPFNVLQDMFMLTPGQHWQDTLFYGVFTSQWNKGAPGSAAVCAFPVQDVQKAFGSLYKEVNRETQQWYTDTQPVPEPRPGACITSHTRQLKINSSLQMPDRVLNFLKDHFLMDSAVRSQPLLLQSQARYQQISVQRVQGLHHSYPVLFLGTGGAEGQGESTGLVYAASYSALAQVPVTNCSLYWSCGECVLSRDPYCAWTGNACLRTPTPWPWVQDIEGADTARLCQSSSVSRPTETASPCQPIRLPPNEVRSLPCWLLSNLASRDWVRDGTSLNASYLVLPGGELVLVGSQERAGRYDCWSQEAGFRQRVASYCVSVEVAAAPQAQPVPGPDTLETVSTFKSTSAEAAGSIATSLEPKSYWLEFLVMCALFGAAVTLLALFLLHRHRDTMKAFLKQGEQASAHPKKPRKPGLPAESLPLNGTSLPSALPDHKGYQTLNDSHVLSTPVHEPPSAGKVFLESDRRPLSIHSSFIEVSAACQRPRVRLGSEIQDSVV